MRPIFVVAQNTIKEILRDRVLYGLLVFVVLMVLFSLLLGGLSIAEQERIITDMGLAAVEVGCCMLAIFVGSSLVWRELERQTVLLLISKPVKRSHFLLGKFLGLSIVIILVDVVVAAFLGLLCHLYGQVFWPQFFAAQFGFILESLFLLSLSLFFGVFCRPVLTTIFTLSVWLIGHGVNDLHYFSEKSKNPIFKDAGIFISRIFPNLDFFNFKDAVVYGDVITTGQIERAFFLWTAWFVILLISSVLIFDRRDFI